MHIKRDHITYAFIFLIVFSALLICTPHDSTLGDPGELITVASTLGIAHPSGYPTYTIIGHVFSKIPIGTKAFRINMMSAFFASLASVLLFNLVRKHATTTAAIATTAFFILIPSIWANSIVAEVYSLHIFLLLGTVKFLLDWMYKKNVKDYYIGIACFAFGLTNHVTTVLLIPIIIYIFVKRRPTLKMLAVSAILGIIILSIYAYMPLRSRADPVIDWGDPETPGAFFDHLRGAQYSYLVGSVSVWDSLVHFTTTSITQLHILMGLIIIGVLNLNSIKRQTLIILAIIAGLFLIFSCFYGIGDIMMYYAPIYLFLTVLAGLGIDFIARRFKGYSTHILIAGILLFAVLQFSLFSTMYQADFHLTRDYAEKVLKDIPPNSVVITPVTKPLSSAVTNTLYWYVYGEGYRPDIALVSAVLLENDWYHGNLFANFGIRVVNPVFDVEYGNSLEPDAQKEYYREMYVREIIRNNPDHNIYRITGTWDDPIVEKV